MSEPLPVADEHYQLVRLEIMYSHQPTHRATLWIEPGKAVNYRLIAQKIFEEHGGAIEVSLFHEDQHTRPLTFNWMHFHPKSPFFGFFPLQ